MEWEGSEKCGKEEATVSGIGINLQMLVYNVELNRRQSRVRPTSSSARRQGGIGSGFTIEDKPLKLIVELITENEAREIKNQPMEVMDEKLTYKTLPYRSVVPILLPEE